MPRFSTRLLALPLTLALALTAPLPALATEQAPSVLHVQTATSSTATAPEVAPTADEAIPDEAAPDFSTFGWRHGQLQLHQVLGLATLGSMAATGGLGYWLARQNGLSGVFDGHLMLAGITTGLYWATAALALTAPESPIKGEENFWDTTVLHHNLAWLHAAGMTATVGFGLLATFHSLSFSSYHGLTGYTTIGLMALSAGVITFLP